MNTAKRLKKLDRTITFWKGFASGVAATLTVLAGLVCLVNYLVQIAQAVK